MPDLLLELFSEEIPARMQARAAEDLRKLVTDRLVEAGLVYEGAKAFVTPRRLTLAVHGVPVRQPDLREEKKGPRVGAPEQAVAGFLKAAGLKSIAEAKVQPDKKGDFYVAVIEKPGRAAIDVIGEILPDVIKSFPWPKSMRWGAPSAEPGALTWVRPLHSIVATFGPETEEPDIVPFKVDGIAAGNVTRGHRFMAPEPFTVRRLDDYVQKLDKAKVVPDAERRKQIILTEAKQLAFAQGLELIEDDGLLDEVAGLVEWPVVLMGSFEESFLRIPEEVIRATIRNNQKCFVLRDAAHAKLVDKFLLVSNIETADGGAAIVAGNERVIRARLSDAKFFYETDLKTRARRSAAKVRAHRVSREARAPRPSALNGLSDWPPNWRRWSAPTRLKQNVRRGFARRICSPKSSANSPSCKAPWANTTPRRRARTKPWRMPARIITGRKGRTIWCRAIRCRSPSRWRTRSIRWSGFGRLMKSRRGARTLMRCGGRRWDVIRIVLVTIISFARWHSTSSTLVDSKDDLDSAETYWNLAFCAEYESSSNDIAENRSGSRENGLCHDRTLRNPSLAVCSFSPTA